MAMGWFFIFTMVSVADPTQSLYVARQVDSQESCAAIAAAINANPTAGGWTLNGGCEQRALSQAP